MSFHRPPAQHGDRNRLSFDERSALEAQVLPTALRWLDTPGLAEHAKQTLAYWGEPIPVRYRGGEA